MIQKSDKELSNICIILYYNYKIQKPFTNGLTKIKLKYKNCGLN